MLDYLYDVKVLEIILSYWHYLVILILCAIPIAIFILDYLYGVKFSWNYKMTNDVNKISSSKISKLTNDKKSFSVLSQNTWCLLLGGGGKRRERIILMISKIKSEKPEFICLQESYCCKLFGVILLCGDLIFLKQQLSNLGYFCCNDPAKSLPRLFGFNNGLMLFSKIMPEKDSCNSIDFDSNKYLPFPKSVVCKGFIYSIFKINSNGDKLLIVNTHFESGIRKCKLGAIQELSDYLRNNIANYDEIKYKLCTGDFNICSNWTWENNINDKDKRLYSILSKTLNEKCGLTFDIFNGFERSYRQTKVDKSATYDHMFINDNLKMLLSNQEIKDWKKNKLVVSDHYGLSASFAQ